VSDFTLTPVSSLHSLPMPVAQGELRAPGVIITERTGVSLCQVLAREGAHTQLAARGVETFGFALPITPRYSGPALISFVWAGPSQWLALSEQLAGQALSASLTSSLADLASVIDLSDARTIVRVSGTHARDALTKGLLIDLHPSAFGPGDAAITAVSHIGVHFWQLDTIPTYEFTMFRSFAVAFCEWLVEASAEFGVAISK
jgi:methylglutamate dehydrogenase subunit D